MTKYSLLFAFLVFAFTGNMVAQQANEPITDITFKVKKSKKLEKQLDKLPIFENSYSGFCVYDVEKAKYVVSYNDQRYFTPASNTKLFAFYAGLEYLGDKLPALKYAVSGDSLIFWGTGNPTLLHPDLPDTLAYNFLKQSKYKLYLSDANFTDKHFGSGWAWDDYNDYYSAEKHSLPVYGNILRFYADTLSGALRVSPPIFTDSITKVFASNRSLTARRNLNSNHFEYQLPVNNKRTQREVPLKQSSQLIAKLLSDTLGREVTLVKNAIEDYQTTTLYTLTVDSLYKPMLKMSDNFYAEHILTMCADSLNGSTDTHTRRLISEITKAKLADLSEQPKWVDGSGLSRYNLFSPRSMVQLLLKIREKCGTDKVGTQRLFELLPNGGEDGTIKRRFKGYPPFIYAKTGTLSNNHNLSGFLVTKSGKLLVFSYMNNHYIMPHNMVRAQTDKVLTDFYLYY